MICQVQVVQPQPTERRGGEMRRDSKARLTTKNTPAGAGVQEKGGQVLLLRLVQREPAAIHFCEAAVLALILDLA